MHVQTVKANGQAEISV